MKLHDLRIGARLTLGFGLVGGLLAAALAASIVLGYLQQTETRERMSIAQTKAVLALQMRGLLLESAVAMRNVALESEVVAFQRQATKARELRKQYAQTLTDFEALGFNDQERALLDQVGELNTAVEKPFAEAVALAQAMDEQAIKVMSAQVDPQQQRQITLLDEIVKLQARFVEHEAKAADARATQTNAVIAACGLAALLLGAFFAWVCTTTVVRPLRRAVEVARGVAAGDLMQDVSWRGKDESAQLLQSLSEMAKQLRGIVSEVRGSSDSITTGSSEIAAGSMDLSQRTEEAAGNLQQTVVSMTRLTQAVRQTAESAGQAAQLAHDATGVADRGGQVVGQVVSSMKSISSSSAKISEIIGVIDGIAFQTNILALNAAVEAARAGEQGRGFAVVAGEVRSLAQRSAAAAKEIKTLIQTSVETVDQGCAYVDQASTGMAEIMANVQRVGTLISEISQNSQLQSAELAEVSDAVSQLDAVTQQNAALVEQSAAAAESLQHQAAAMTQLVSVFRVEA